MAVWSFSGCETTIKSPPTLNFIDILIDSYDVSHLLIWGNWFCHSGLQHYLNDAILFPTNQNQQAGVEQSQHPWWRQSTNKNTEEVDEYMSVIADLLVAPCLSTRFTFLNLNPTQLSAYVLLPFTHDGLYMCAALYTPNAHIVTILHDVQFNPPEPGPPFKTGIPMNNQVRYAQFFKRRIKLKVMNNMSQIRRLYKEVLF